MYIPIRSVARGLVENGYRGTVPVRPEYTAATGAVYSGKPIKVHTEDWLKG